MDFWKRAAGRSRRERERLRNERIRQVMNVPIQ